MPAGMGFVNFLADSPRFPQVGKKTAQRLWDALGEDLFQAIAERNYEIIAKVTGIRAARFIVDEVSALAGEIQVHHGFDRYGVAPKTAFAAFAIWRSEALDKIKSNPYRLSVLESWRSVDDRAQKLGVALTDSRRLIAAVEEVLGQRYKNGSTASQRGVVKGLLPSVLGSRAVYDFDVAIDAAIESGSVVVDPSGLLQGRGAAWMERELGRMLALRLGRETLQPSAEEIELAITTVEEEGGISFSPSQRAAVRMAATSPLSIISGGAGTGKTTILCAVLLACEARKRLLPRHMHRSYQFSLLALSGRAAQRIGVATGRKAMTIARFLKRLEFSCSNDRLAGGLLVVDEASMLDLPLAYELVRSLPESVDILFLGDPAQLPPIGPGLVFHRLVESDALPHVRLATIYRQGNETGIPFVANEVRQGRLPELPRFDPLRPGREGVFVVGSDDVARDAIEVFSAMAGEVPQKGNMRVLHDLDIQILAATQGGGAGVKRLNLAVEQRYAKNQESIRGLGLSVGSKVVWLR